MKGVKITILIILMIASTLFATDTLVTYWYKNQGNNIDFPNDVSINVQNSAGSSEVTYKAVVKVICTDPDPDYYVCPSGASISHSGCKFKYTGGNETLAFSLATVKETASFISGNANDLPNSDAKARMRVSVTGWDDVFTSPEMADEETYNESYTEEESNQ